MHQQWSERLTELGFRALQWRKRAWFVLVAVAILGAALGGGAAPVFADGDPSPGP